MMYFLNEVHEENYETLMNLYQLRSGQDVQYEANIYIAALPEIFECFNLNGIDTNFGPLNGLVNDELKEQGGHHAEGLTGSTHRLTAAGISLYNGKPVGLDELFGTVASDDLFRVFIQACKIRAKKNYIAV